jgi:large subunit ribosomal protein L18
MKREKRKQDMRRRRHFRVSNRVRGTAGRPRLAVSRTLKHIYAQVIDDQARRTLVSTSTLAEEVRKQVKSGGNVKAAELVGTQIAQLARAAGIEKVAFDRGPCRFHGRVKALAEAARKGGLKF